MAKYRIRYHERFNDNTGIVDTPEFDDSNVDFMIEQLKEKFPQCILTKEVVTASFDTGKKQVEVMGYKAVKDMQIAQDIFIKKGHELKVITKDNKQMLGTVVNNKEFYFDPIKLTNEPMFNNYFEKMYG